MDKNKVKKIICELKLKNYIINMDGSLLMRDILNNTNYLNIKISENEYFNIRDKFELKETISVLGDNRINLSYLDENVEFILTENIHNHEVVDGVRCQSITDICRIKSYLNRNIDIDDLQKIKEYLK